MCPTLVLYDMPNIDYTITDELMQENQPIASVMDTNISEEVSQHHTGELSQHSDAVNYSTLITATARVSYKDLSYITGQLVAAVVNSRKRQTVSCIIILNDSGN